MIGVGAIIGAGIFVIIGAAAGMAEPAVVLSMLIAAASFFTATSFASLTYYAITNYSALKLSGRRKYGRLFSGLGLASCIILIPFLGMDALIDGIAVTAAGLAYYFMLGKNRK